MWEQVPFAFSLKQPRLIAVVVTKKSSLFSSPCLTNKQLPANGTICVIPVTPASFAFPSYQSGSWEAARTNPRPCSVFPNNIMSLDVPPQRRLLFWRIVLVALSLNSAAPSIISLHFAALLFDLLCTWESFHIHWHTVAQVTEVFLTASQMEFFFVLFFSFLSSLLFLGNHQEARKTALFSCRYYLKSKNEDWSHIFGLFQTLFNL